MNRSPSPAAAPAPTTPPTVGGLAAFTSYLLWGVLPIYWKQLGDQSALELTAHRMAWTLAWVVGFQVLRGHGRALLETWRDPANRRAHAINACLLSGNWGFYVWAIGHDRIIEASLGYFLVPLFNVTLGRVVFGETLSRLQKIAVTLAAAGVGVMILQVGVVPWIALGLAGTWAGYGLVRKRSHASALNGLVLETSFAAPLAIGCMIWLAQHEDTGFGRADTVTTVLYIGTGLISMVPLVLFGVGARRLRLTTLGLLQYIAPTCQFLIGWLVYREPFSASQAGAFALIWSGLACYSFDSWRARRMRPAAVAVTAAPGAE